MAFTQLRISASLACPEAVHLGQEITPNRMNNDLEHSARELHVPVTILRVSGGLLFRRSSEEDLQLAQETASCLQTAQRGR